MGSRAPSTRERCVRSVLGLRDGLGGLRQHVEQVADDAEVDELVTVYEGRLLAAFEGVLRAGMVIANVSLITLS